MHAAAGGDPALAALATRQHGLAASAQLRASVSGGGLIAFERDRRRDAELLAAG